MLRNFVLLLAIGFSKAQDFIEPYNGNGVNPQLDQLKKQNEL